MNTTSGNLTLQEGGEQVITEDQTELIVSLLCLFTPVLIAIITQLLVIVTIRITPSLHEPHFYILLTCCAADLASVAISTLGKVTVFLQGRRPWMCDRRLFQGTLDIIFLGSTLKVAVIAYERFVYFVQPFKYLPSFTAWRIAGAVLVPYIISAVWVVVTNFTHRRDFHASVLGCQLPHDPWLLGCQITLFLAPPSLMSLFTIVRVLRLTRNVSPEAVSTSATPVQQIRRAVRMLLLMSGTFWLTVVPGHVAQIVVFASGISWDDIDSRRNRAAAFTMRSLIWMYIWFPPAINPAIYLYSRRDLRTAMLRKLCRNNQVSPN